MITKAEKLIDILNSVKIHGDDNPTPGTALSGMHVLSITHISGNLNTRERSFTKCVFIC